MNDLLAFMAQKGLPFSGYINFDGKLNRYSCRNDKPLETDEWYVAKEWDYKGKTYQRVVFGSWRFPDTKHTWTSWKDGEIDVEALKYAEKEQQKLNKALEEERQIRIKGLKEYFENLPSCGKHPYLEKKHIEDFPLDFKQDNTDLIIPRYNPSMEVVAYVKIPEEGKKINARGVKAKGTFYRFDGDTRKIYIAEGIATAYSVHKATEATVYCAFGCHGCIDIASVARTLHKGSEIVYCRDTGQECDDIEKKMSDQGVSTVRPLCDTDFNDQHVKMGLDSVKKSLGNKSWTPISFENRRELPIEKDEYYIHKIIPKASAVLITGGTGSTKSRQSLEIAFRLAIGRSVYDWKIDRPYKVLYIDAENRRNDLLQREKTLEDSYFNPINSLTGEKVKDAKAPPEEFVFDVLDKDSLVEQGRINLYDIQDRENLEELVEPYDVIFMDNFFQMISLESNGHTEKHYLASSWEPIKRWIDELCTKTGKSIVLINHSNESDGTVRGTKNMVYSFETVLNLVRENPDNVPDKYLSIVEIVTLKGRTMSAKESKTKIVGYNPESSWSNKWRLLERHQNSFTEK